MKKKLVLFILTLTISLFIFSCKKKESDNYDWLVGTWNRVSCGCNCSGHYESITLNSNKTAIATNPSLNGTWYVEYDNLVLTNAGTPYWCMQINKESNTRFFIVDLDSCKVTYQK